jgi:oxygen-independent coproporphyrinogen-3 oxidase
MSDEPVAVYVHTPFCLSKCGYCDFNSYAMRGEIVQRTVDAILGEIERSPFRARPAKTIYFGGGTPTFLEQDQLLGIFNAVLDAHPPMPDAEITCEANPGTADAEKFAAMRRAGFNRLSMGAQSFLDSDLKQLGRAHSVADVGSSVGLARQAGFENLSLDLMFALPGQSGPRWMDNVHAAIDLLPEHLSLYCLTFEPGTAFHRLLQIGKLNQPDDDAQVEMYEACVEALDRRGYAQYEISNFAQPGEEGRHNLCYWHGEQYVAYGPGAVGAVSGFEGEPDRVRYTNLRAPSSYCEAVESRAPLWEEREPLDPATLRTERIMLGLRLNEGVPATELSLDEAVVKSLAGRGLVEHIEDRVKLTRIGRNFCNDVAAELI